MDTSAIDKVIGEMRAQVRAVSSGISRPAGAVAGAAPEFAELLKSSIDSVNRGQVDATQLARQFELGTPSVNLNDVMISMQKANLSFQQMVQVRNRLVAAYNEIMNMQV